VECELRARTETLGARPGLQLRMPLEESYALTTGITGAGDGQRVQHTAGDGAINAREIQALFEQVAQRRVVEQGSWILSRQPAQRQRGQPARTGPGNA